VDAGGAYRGIKIEEVFFAPTAGTDSPTLAGAVDFFLLTKTISPCVGHAQMRILLFYIYFYLKISIVSNISIVMRIKFSTFVSWTKNRLIIGGIC
jgi:hypothetical protein